MKKAIPLINLLIVAIITFGLIGCSGGSKQGPGDQEDSQQGTEQESEEEIRKKVMEEVKKKMEKMEDEIEVMDAHTAYELALKEADKWDKDAHLYYLEGEKDINPDGTAKQWTAYFAVREDPQDTPGREQGKKLVVLMQDAQVMRVESKEDPEDISYTQDCYQFLPDDWMDSESGYAKCLDALREKHGDDVDNGKPQHLKVRTAEYYKSGDGWIIKPAWQLSYKTGDNYQNAEVHAVTGEVLEVK